ncbi:hypothetical protein AB1Y20_013792 [Prymnesium parvum]|uniref:Nitroreductase domain-containing protein n=1 Tax=Prymnesium parvum TaxID=97485 RepID=A0AB34IHF8_PRYPA
MLRHLAAFTVESQLIAASLSAAILCLGWWAYCRCSRENGKHASASVQRSHEAAVVSLTLFLVSCAYSTTVRNAIAAWAGQLAVVPAVLVLGAAALLPLSFESIFPSAAASGPVAPLLPSAAATARLIRSRRSVFPKDYNGASVPRAAIERALEAANWAPTHGKTEAWRFTVFAGGQRIAQLEEAKLRALHEQLPPDQLPAALEKMERKRKDVAKVSHIIAIVVKRVRNAKGSLMPAWEETCSVACAVQNMHLSLTAEGFACYWSSGGVGGWAEAEAIRSLVGADGAVEGERDQVLGWFYVGCSSRMDFYKGRRGPIADKVTWLESE